jgi:hypothetical protein
VFDDLLVNGFDIVLLRLPEHAIPQDHNVSGFFGPFAADIHALVFER